MEYKINKDDYLSISKFATLAGVSRKTLIYYDNIGVFSPEITLDNGYRYYYYRQLYTINMICALKDIGVSLKEIIEYTQNRSPEKLIKLFKTQLVSVDNEINHLKQTRDMMSMHIESSKIAMNANMFVVEIKHLEKEPIFISNEIPKIEGQRVTFSKMLTKFYQYASIHGYHASFPWGIKIDINAYDEQLHSENEHANNNQLSFYYRIPSSKTYKPAGMYLVFYAYGEHYGFHNRNDSYQRLMDYAKEHNYELHSDLYVDYLTNEMSAKHPENYLIRLTIAVKT